MLYICANETAMYQPKAVHYIAMVCIMYLFQRSFVRLDKDSNCIFRSHNHSTNASFLVVSFSAEAYWNIYPALSVVLQYCLSLFYYLRISLLFYVFTSRCIFYYFFNDYLPHLFTTFFVFFFICGFTNVGISFSIVYIVVVFVANFIMLHS